MLSRAESIAQNVRLAIVNDKRNERTTRIRGGRQDWIVPLVRL
jgi:hypothetical protein